MRLLLVVLAILACGPGPGAMCEAPCPGATSQLQGQDGTICWCGTAMGFQPAVLFGDLCDLERAAWLEALPDGGCPQKGGGHAP